MAERPVAPATELPAGLDHYRSTPLFTEESVPAALLGDHSTKPGVWGRIRLVSGRLRYVVTDARRQALARELTEHSDPGIIEPTIVHRVELIGKVEFQVEFWRTNGVR